MDLEKLDDRLSEKHAEKRELDDQVENLKRQIAWLEDEKEERDRVIRSALTIIRIAKRLLFPQLVENPGAHRMKELTAEERMVIETEITLASPAAHFSANRESRDDS